MRASPATLAVRFLVLCWFAGLACAAWADDVHTLAAAQVRQAGAASPFVPVSLPHDWEQDFPAFTGTVEYRIAFAAPAGEGLVGLYIRRACSNLEVFVNGEAVGSGGRMEAPLTRNCYYPQLFPLPRKLLLQGSNELRIRVAGYAAREVSARQRAGGLSTVRLGPLAELREDYASQLFWNVTLAQIIAALLTALGAGMLALWSARRGERYLLYFGLFTCGWAMISARLFVRDVPLGNHLLEALICAGFFPVGACAFLFMMRLVDRRWAWMDRALWLQALLVPAVLLAIPRTSLLATATFFYNLIAIEFAACVLAFLVLAWRTHRREFWVLGLVLLVLVLLAAAEIGLQNGGLPLPRVHLLHFAMPLVFVVIGTRLIQLFVRALRQAETLNQQLEQRVADKSREIERSWRQVAQLRADQATQEERRRIASDLHDDLGAQLLTIVQASQRAGDAERIAGLARHALDEMRLSVRGLTGGAAAAGDALADWRAETVTRLGDAGIAAEWQAAEPPPELILPARTHVQLTRVLREAVSNAIRHSGARRVRVEVGFAEGTLRMLVEDDGCGLLPQAEGLRRGHGLPNIERRVRNLEGRHQLERPDGGGTRLVVHVPLPAPGPAHAQEAP